MSLDSKWSEGLTPAMPLVEAARLILAARFDTLLKWWTPAEPQPNETESVHHLRVASRRASAAIGAFDDLIPRRQVRKLKSQIRGIRDAAGDVRDRDVFLIQLADWAKSRSADERPGLDYLFGIWTHMRLRRYQRLVPKLEQHERFADLAAAMRLRGGRKTSLGDHAAELLPELVGEFNDAANEHGNDPDRLHAIRILGKRLRYSLELFACCFSHDDIATPYDMLEELQDLLGAAHDAEISARRVKRELECVKENDRYRPGIVAWLAHLQGIENDGPGRFDEWACRWRKVAPALDSGMANNS